MVNWNEHFMKHAREIAKSSNRRTKVGCVVVDRANQILSTGFDGFPRGVNSAMEKHHLTPEKSLWTEHAERNAIYSTARTGIPLLEATIYRCSFPCVNCARAIVQCGMEKVVALKPDLRHQRWGYEFVVALDILKEGGVEIEYYVSDHV